MRCVWGHGRSFCFQGTKINCSTHTVCTRLLSIVSLLTVFVCLLDFSLWRCDDWSSAIQQAHLKSCANCGTCSTSFSYLVSRRVSCPNPTRRTLIPTTLGYCLSVVSKNILWSRIGHPFVVKVTARSQNQDLVAPIQLVRHATLVPRWSEVINMIIGDGAIFVILFAAKYSWSDLWIFVSILVLEAGNK